MSDVAVPAVRAGGEPERAELTTAEKDDHRLRLAALLKGRRVDKPSTGLAVSGPRGAGASGGSRAASRRPRASLKAAIQKAEQRAAEAIGEPVDLERDTPAEERKAARCGRRQAAQAKPRPSRRSGAPRPKRPDGLAR